MAIPYSYMRYLEAKRSVDDRALNRPVFQTLQENLRSHPTESDLQILDLGGGTGSMIRRSLQWALISGGTYTIVDQSDEALDSIPEAMKAFCEETLPEAKWHQSGEKLSLQHGEHTLHIERVHSDLQDFLGKTAQRYDLIIANAVLDLVDVDQVLPAIWKVCRPGALFWFTINFDGESVFLPSLPEDAAIFEAYHTSMDSRPGSRAAGRALFSQMANQGIAISAAGSSDWVVHAHEGRYVDEEEYFLHHIVHTVDQELCEHPDLPSDSFQQWIALRHQHISQGELIYIAHQLDFTGFAPLQKSTP